MHDIDAIPLKVNHTTVYAHIVIACCRPKYVCVQSLTIQQWCKHRCKRRLMHDINVLPLKFNHTTVYAHIVIACCRPKYVCVQSLTIQQ